MPTCSLVANFLSTLCTQDWNALSPIGQNIFTRAGLLEKSIDQLGAEKSGFGALVGCILIKFLHFWWDLTFGEHLVELAGLMEISGFLGIWSLILLIFLFLFLFFFILLIILFCSWGVEFLSPRLGLLSECFALCLCFGFCLSCLFFVFFLFLLLLLHCFGCSFGTNFGCRSLLGTGFDFLFWLFRLVILLSRSCFCLLLFFFFCWCCFSICFFRCFPFFTLLFLFLWWSFRISCSSRPFQLALPSHGWH